MPGHPGQQQTGTGQPAQRLIASRYALVSELGRGGMGIVWLAEDRTIGRRVAIKELHLPDGVPPAERSIYEERVLREARTAGRLNDPAVVTVYDVVQEAAKTYIVMEVIEAPTLSDLVAQRGPLPQGAVAALATQLLSALEAAHTAGIVHRDVKPSNVMVLPNGRVKLTDFGIAQSLDDPRLTTSGVLIGSPVYMAPERIGGAEADAGSDLWALGAVLFFAVEGYNPFERSSTAATMHAIMTEVPYLTKCQGPLASVIMGLLISAPQARLRAEQMRALLSQTPTGPHTGPQPAMYGGTAPYAPPPNNQTMLVPSGPAPRKAGRTWLIVALVVLLAAAAYFGGLLTGKAVGNSSAAPADPARGETFTYGRDGQIPQFEVSNTACGGSPLVAGRSVPSGADCDKEHDFQVFAADAPTSFDIAWPGEATLKAYGENWCGLLFASRLITPPDKADKLTYLTLIPSKTQWDTDKSGGKYVLCAVRARDRSQLSGTVLAER
jgi:hypothetical protein